MVKLWSIAHILRPANELGFKPVIDAKQNIIIRVGDGAETLFSCHTDTVHWKEGFQEVHYDEQMGMCWKQDRDPLGADDGAGVYVLMRLLAEKKPGLYIFHAGEEKGCIGSRHIAENTPKLLKGIKRAIAFDRRGTQSIITRMSGGDVCSSEFSKALAEAIGMGHKDDPTGSITDTKQYKYIVDECTNVSVGYDHEHGPNETLDLDYLYDLVDHLISVDFEKLPVKRCAEEELEKVLAEEARRKASWSSQSSFGYEHGYGGYPSGRHTGGYGHYRGPSNRSPANPTWVRNSQGVLVAHYPGDPWPDDGAVNVHNRRTTHDVSATGVEDDGIPRFTDAGRPWPFPTREEGDPQASTQTSEGEEGDIIIPKMPDPEEATEEWITAVMELTGLNISDGPEVALIEDALRVYVRQKPRDVRKYTAEIEAEYLCDVEEDPPATSGGLGI